jgi:hypothetical protein
MTTQFKVTFLAAVILIVVIIPTTAAELTYKEYARETEAWRRGFLLGIAQYLSAVAQPDEAALPGQDCLPAMPFWRKRQYACPPYGYLRRAKRSKFDGADDPHRSTGILRFVPVGNRQGPIAQAFTQSMNTLSARRDVHVEYHVGRECGLRQYPSASPAGPCIGAPERSRSISMKQVRPVLLKSIRTPPCPAIAFLISREPKP